MSRRAAFGGGAARTAAVLGHELRNPLGAALANAALACEMVDVADPRRVVLESVVSDLERMGGLLDSYLGFARLGKPARAPVMIASLVLRIAARRPQLRSTIAADLVTLGDAVLLERALENLVDNAVEVGASAIDIAALMLGERIIVTVSDNGPGVPSKLREVIFDPGFSRRGSTGLGLCIVAETIAAHGGLIRCEVCARGSRFVIELPSHSRFANA